MARDTRRGGKRKVSKNIAASGVHLNDVLAELARRQGTSGIEEKANR